MKVIEAYRKLQKLVEAGHGEAVIVHTDTRSGVTERAHIGSSISVVDGEEFDFYADLDVGDEYLEIYEGD